MPELPEVETIRRQIAPSVAGQRILSAQVTHPRAVRGYGTPTSFVAAITGRRVLDVRRRGKVLLLPLDSGDSLLVRLGMSGRLQVVDPDALSAPHTHVILLLENGRELRFIDPRTFGGMTLATGHDPDRMVELGHYGPEPLDDAFTPETLMTILAAKRAGIQVVLMDQSQVAGIGKIYADEACFLAGIHPQRSADSLSPDDITRLHAAIRQVLSHSIQVRGTSSQDAAYRDAHGDTGGFQHFLHVYQRANQACRVCGASIEYRPIQGRRMHFCPRCQK